MNDSGMKTVKIVVLVAVIAVAAFFIYRVAGKGAPGASPIPIGAPLEMMDAKTLETETLTIGEWNKRGVKNDRYKNAKTGEYTMMPVIICNQCKAKIPLPFQPDNYYEMAEGERDAAMSKIYNTYVCPKCGKLAIH